MKRLFLGLTFFIGINTFVKAQGTDCAAQLSLAEAEFEAGHIEAIPRILDSCLKDFTDAQLVEAYRLLSITYLYLDDPIGAKNSYLELLKIEPQFKPSASDPIELVYLSKQYITTPIISFFGKAGANFSNATVLHSNPLTNETDPSKYKLGVGFNLAAGMDLHLTQSLSLAFEAEFSSRSLKRETIIFPTEPQVVSSSKLNLHGSLPIMVKYYFPIKEKEKKKGKEEKKAKSDKNLVKTVKYLPYIYAGYSPSITISSSLNGLRDPNKEATHENLGLKVISQTPGFSQSLIFGAGIKKRVGDRFGYRYVTLDVRYRYGMTNMNNGKGQYDFTNLDTQKQVFTQVIGEDDFRWNGVEVTIGYVLPVYKARERGSDTIQTTMKKWFGKKNKTNE